MDTQKREHNGDSPGGPVVKIPYSQCRGAGLIPGRETKIPKLRFWGVAKKKKKKERRKNTVASSGGKNLQLGLDSWAAFGNVWR